LAFSVAPALCPSVPPHSKSGGAGFTKQTATPTLTSRISHRICTNYGSGRGRPGGAVAPFAPY